MCPRKRNSFNQILVFANKYVKNLQKRFRVRFVVTNSILKAVFLTSRTYFMPEKLFKDLAENISVFKINYFILNLIIRVIKY